MAGRKPKPTYLKLLGGQKKPSRFNENEPAPNLGTPPAPDWLSARATEIFDRIGAILFGMGISSPDDVDALAMLSSRLEEIEILTGIIEDSGRTYQIKGGPWKARPEVAMRNEAMRHAQALLAEFGLTPAARQKVSSAAGGKKANPFAALESA